MIERILAPAVAAAEQVGAPVDAELFPAERAHIARAVDSRRREFSSVRWCARQAMRRLGLPPAAVLPDPRGAPQWPDGVVGSMTHCAGYSAAALATDPAVLGIGIDAEPDGPLPPGVLDAVSLPPERQWLDGAPTGVAWDRILFSAKESTYKVWYPLTGRWLGFEDAHITLDPGGTFTTSFLVEPPIVGGVPLRQVTGRWLVSEGLVLTAIVLSAPR